MKKVGKNKTNKKIIGIIVLAILVIAIILVVLFFKHNDNNYIEEYDFTWGIPGENIKAEINKKTKVFKATVTNYCSFPGCEPSHYDCELTLTDEEYKNIMKLGHDQRKLETAFDLLCHNDSVFYDSFEDTVAESIEEYNKKDANSDGKVTSREFADYLLDYCVNNMDECK